MLVTCDIRATPMFAGESVLANLMGRLVFSI